MQLPTVEAYAELQAAFDFFNARLFEGTLRPCILTLQREKRSLGYFSHKRFVHRGDSKRTVDEIAINPAYFATEPLVEVLGTVAHEMAHLWQAQFGKPGRRGYHNREWGEKMEAIGLMPSATGKPGGPRTGEHMSHYAIEGGPFLAAAEAFLATGATVSWLDRVTAKPPLDPKPTGYIEVIDMRGERGAGAPGKPLYAPGDDEVLRLQKALGNELTYPPEKGVLPNRSNRLKYECPRCHAHVWGKPALRVLCGRETCGCAAFEVVG